MTCQIIDLGVIRAVKTVLQGRDLPALINPASLSVVVGDDGTIVVGVEAYAAADDKWIPVAWGLDRNVSAGIALDVNRGLRANGAIAPAEPLAPSLPRRVPKWTTCRAAPDGRPCAPREEGGCRRRSGHRGGHRDAAGNEWGEPEATSLTETRAQETADVEVGNC